MATLLRFGALLAGPGTLWIDDLEVLIDGKPYAAAPMVERELLERRVLPLPFILLPAGGPA